MFDHCPEVIFIVKDLVRSFFSEAFGKFLPIFFADIKHLLLPIQGILLTCVAVEAGLQFFFIFFVHRPELLCFFRCKGEFAREEGYVHGFQSLNTGSGFSWPAGLRQYGHEGGDPKGQGDDLFHFI